MIFNEALLAQLPDGLLDALKINNKLPVSFPTEADVLADTKVGEYCSSTCSDVYSEYQDKSKRIRQQAALLLQKNNVPAILRPLPKNKCNPYAPTHTIDGCHGMAVNTSVGSSTAVPNAATASVVPTAAPTATPTATPVTTVPTATAMPTATTMPTTTPATAMSTATHTATPTTTVPTTTRTAAPAVPTATAVPPVAMNQDTPQPPAAFSARTETGKRSKIDTAAHLASVFKGAAAGAAAGGASVNEQIDIADAVAGVFADDMNQDTPQPPAAFSARTETGKRSKIDTAAHLAAYTQLNKDEAVRLQQNAVTAASTALPEENVEELAFNLGLKQYLEEGGGGKKGEDRLRDYRVNDVQFQTADSLAQERLRKKQIRAENVRKKLLAARREIEEKTSGNLPEVLLEGGKPLSSLQRAVHLSSLSEGDSIPVEKDDIDSILFNIGVRQEEERKLRAEDRLRDYRAGGTAINVTEEREKKYKDYIQRNRDRSRAERLAELRGLLQKNVIQPQLQKQLLSERERERLTTYRNNQVKFQTHESLNKERLENVQKRTQESRLDYLNKRRGLDILKEKITDLQAEAEQAEKSATLAVENAVLLNESDMLDPVEQSNLSYSSLQAAAKASAARIRAEQQQQQLMEEQTLTEARLHARDDEAEIANRIEDLQKTYMIIENNLNKGIIPEGNDGNDENDDISFLDNSFHSVNTFLGFENEQQTQSDHLDEDLDDDVSITEDMVREINAPVLIEVFDLARSNDDSLIAKMENNSEYLSFH
jgi:hypothetical protein